MLSTIPQNVKITINSVTKKYGEAIPAYSFDVTINDVPLANTGQTLSTLGLTDITFSSNAVSTSDIGLYYRRGASAVTDLSNPLSLTLSELYNYQFIDGVLTIDRMPIMVTPQDVTLVYGQSINGKQMQFNYAYDASNIDPLDQVNFLDSLETEHQSTMSSSVVLVDGKQAVNGVTLTAVSYTHLTLPTSDLV